jgi:hypothetical protein
MFDKITKGIIICFALGFVLILLSMVISPSGQNTTDASFIPANEFVGDSEIAAILFLGGIFVIIIGGCITLFSMIGGFDKKK